MAGTRVEKIGSIFKRVEGLYKGGVLKREELPVWFSVYEAFPPKVEPELTRPVPAANIQDLLYVEDHIRGYFTKTYQIQTSGHVNMMKPNTMENLVMDRFVQEFVKIAKSDDSKGSKEILSLVEKSLISQGYKLARKKTDI